MDDEAKAADKAAKVAAAKKKVAFDHLLLSHHPPLGLHACCHPLCSDLGASFASVLGTTPLCGRQPKCSGSNKRGWHRCPPAYGALKVARARPAGCRGSHQHYTVTAKHRKSTLQVGRRKQGLTIAGVPRHTRNSWQPCSMGSCCTRSPLVPPRFAS